MNSIIQGDVLESLKKLPDESVNCIVTSPPYWGMRDYGPETRRIWGGEKDCQHEWEEELTVRIRGSYENANVGSNKKGCQPKELRHGSFCIKCDAWYGQLGLEPTLDLYFDHLLEITAELKRILKPDGVMFWNHGDGYNGGNGWAGGGGRSNRDTSWKRKFAEYAMVEKPPTATYRGLPVKCLTLQGPRLAIRMVEEQGWILRNDIIWYKPNHMPESVKDRFTKAYEHVFMFVKSRKYHFDLDAVREPYTKPLNRWGGEKLRARGCSSWDLGTGQNIYRDRSMRPNPLGKNPGDVWIINTEPFLDAHFAVFPEALAERCILAGCIEGGIVMDPFLGSGTTAFVALRLNRRFVGIEINPEYCKMALKRVQPLLNQKKLTEFSAKSKMEVIG